MTVTKPPGYTYTRKADFTGYEAANPNSPKRATDLNAELNAVKVSVDQVQANLDLLQKDDGTLENGIVTDLNLAQSALDLITTLAQTPPATTGANVSIVDAGNYFPTNTVEAALQTAGAQIAANTARPQTTVNGLGPGAVTLGASNIAIVDAGNRITGTNVETALQELAGSISANGTAIAAIPYAVTQVNGFAPDVPGASGPLTLKANRVPIDDTANNFVATNVEAALAELANITASAGGVASVNAKTGLVVLVPSDIGAVATSAVGAASGVAPLDSGSKIPMANLPASIVGAMNYQGTWNAQTNIPPMAAAAAGNKGYYFKVSTAGNTTIDGNTGWAIGDWIVSNGGTWDKIDNTDAVTTVAGRTGAIVIAESDVTNLVTDLGLKAPLASPALTGVPTAPTATVGTNTTQIATTAFVQASSDSSKANLASPAFTGVPTAPTAVAGTNTTQLATTAFVQGKVDKTGDSMSGGLDFGSVVVTTATDLTRHVALHVTANYGFGVTANNLNYNAGTGANHSFYIASGLIAKINASGLSLKNANSATMVVQPRQFVQSADPGAAAADGDLWIW